MIDNKAHACASLAISVPIYAPGLEEADGASVGP
jgi:hypothetical protein